MTGHAALYISQPAKTNFKLLYGDFVSTVLIKW